MDKGGKVRGSFCEQEMHKMYVRSLGSSGKRSVKAVFRTLYLLVNKEISAINLKIWVNESKQRREWARINFSPAKEKRDASAQRRKVNYAPGHCQMYRRCRTR